MWIASAATGSARAARGRNRARGRARGSGRGSTDARQNQADEADPSSDSDDIDIQQSSMGPAARTVATRGAKKPGGYREGSVSSEEQSGSEDSAGHMGA